MDETEVQVEIACWAQNHPEASMINWKNGNEPWVSFEGKRCTLHVGLGGLTWRVEVPYGYQTERNPGDGKWNRLWEPLDYHDVVIIPSKSTPFLVSVVDHANNVLDLTLGLDVEFAKKASLNIPTVEGVYEQEKIHDMVKTLRVVQLEDPSGDGQGLEEARTARIISDSCFAALQIAETLSEVLDAIHGLAKIYSKYRFSHLKDGDVGKCDDNDDDDDFLGTEIAIKWSWIKSQVLYAQEACVAARIAQFRFSEAVNEDGPQPAIILSLALPCTPELVEPDMQWSDVFNPRSFSLADTVNPSQASTNKSPSPAFDTDEMLKTPHIDFYAAETVKYNSPRESNAEDLPETGSWAVDLESNTEDMLNAFQILECDSDTASDSSDNSWEIVGDEANSKAKDVTTSSDSESKAKDGPSSSASASKAKDGTSSSDSKSKGKEVTSCNDSELDVAKDGNPSTSKVYGGMPSGSSKRKFEDTHLPEGSQRVLGRQPSVKRPSPESRQMPKTPANELQYCDVAFNPVSFSVECIIRLSEFMLPASATALGFTLEHPLRVEIVPNKAQVDSRGWTGAVEVYVSQHSDWHNHFSEEICGLLCLVPNIVQKYFQSSFEILIYTKKEPQGDLFIGVLEALVSKLTRVNNGDSCCVCGMPAYRPSSLFKECNVVWPCSHSLCQATFRIWQGVSSLDAREREREVDDALQSMERTLRIRYPCLDAKACASLKSTLEVFDVSTKDMSYIEMIRALAGIEVWNDNDDSCSGWH